MPDHREAVDTSIDGALLITPDGPQRASVGIRSGRIVRIGSPDARASKRIDAKGLLILPGFVDTHVHLMEPADPTREDWAHGTAAAIASGVTTIVEHTHGAPVRDAQELAAKVAWLKGRSHVDFGLAAHAWPSRLDAIEGLWREGATFVKIFTCTTHGIPRLTRTQMINLFRVTAGLNMPSLVHCEDEQLVSDAADRLRRAGRTDSALLTEWRSRTAEDVAVEMTLEIAAATGAPVAVAHASRLEVVDAVMQARTRGANVVAESCPQYLTLFEDEVQHHAGLRKFTPPARARSVEEHLGMWTALEAGQINHVSSDHAPSTRIQKTDGDIWESPFGLPGLDTTSSLLIDAAIKGDISLERLAESYAAAPARWYGLKGKGSIEIGADADLVLIDPTVERVISDSIVRSKSGWTPYDGQRVRGQVVRTFLRGRLAFSDGMVLPPRGVHLRGPGHAA